MAIAVGTRAPNIALKSATGEIVQLRDVLKDRVAVLGFYHFAFTGG